MLNYMITFFILAIIASVLGFSGLATDFAEIAKFLALLFVVLFTVTIVYDIVTGHDVDPPM